MSDATTVDPATGEIMPVQSEFWTAFGKAQAEIETPKANKPVDVTLNTGRSFKFSYAALDQIIAVARKPLADNGLCLYQEVTYQGGQPFVRTRIIHTTGQFVASTYPIFTSTQGSQGFGSGVTYARRYSLLLALGIAAEDDDDDGNAADGNKMTPRGQQQQQPWQRPAGVTRALQQQPTRPANGEADAARAVVNRVKAAIETATTVEQLNKAWTEDDRKSVVAQNKPNNPIGDKVWKQLMDREADKRLQLVGETELDKYEAGSGGEDEFMSEEEANNVFAR